MAEYTWISDEKILAELSEENRVGCLNFFDFSFTDINIQRMELALKGRKVERIGITSCRGKLDQALTLIFGHVHVECLKLDCLDIKPTTAKIIGQGVASCSSLKSLSLQALNMTESFANALHHALCRTNHLESLYLSVLGTTQSYRILVDMILDGFQSNRSLKHLGIARVRGMESSRVFESIQNHSSLESVSFASMDGITSSTLTSLEDLSNCPHSKVTTIKLSVRGDWTGLRHLPTQSCNKRPFYYKLTISTSDQFCDMQLLGEILERNENIQSLSLAHCGLDDEKISQLASFLGRVKGLKELNLYGNSLNSGRGCDALLAALQYNHSLERIDLPTLVDQRAALEHLLDCNRAGRRLHQDVNAPVALWPLVLQRASSIDYTKRYPLFRCPDEIAARRANAIFHLLQGQVLCH